MLIICIQFVLTFYLWINWELYHDVRLTKMYFEHAPIRCSDHIIVLQPDQSRFLVLKSIIFDWIIWIDMWLCLNNCHQVLIFRRGSISHISHHPLSCFQLIILSEPVIFTHPPATCVVISTKIMETMVIF